MRRHLEIGNRVAKQLLLTAISRHEAMFEDVQFVALLEPKSKEHKHTTIRAYGRDGWMCLTIHLRDRASHDEVWPYSSEDRDRWQRLGDKPIRLFFELAEFELSSGMLIGDR
ncbi:hypothetical protein ONZ45_g8443 [Pleurotus djamor]|nr:hypothetical protein ONZ45_g8443 [Pleurotus djamor]